MFDAEVHGAAFTDLLRNLQPAAESRHSPFRHLVLLSARGGEVSATASRSDLTIVVRLREGAEVGGEGDLTVHYRALVHAAAGVSGSWISLSEENDSLVIRSLDSEAKLPTVVDSELPNPARPTSEPAEWSTEVLGAVRMASYAAAEPGSSVLSGLRLSGSMAMASDTYRAALVRLPSDVGEAIVPADVIGLVADAASNGCTVRLGSNSAQWDVDGICWTTAVLQGEFLDVEGVLARPHPLNVRVDTARLRSALEYVAFFEDVVRVDLEAERVQLSAGGEEGEVRDELPAASDATGTVFVRKSHLSDVLDRLKGHEVDIEIADGGDSLRIIEAPASHLVMCLVRPEVVKPRRRDGRT